MPCRKYRASFPQVSKFYRERIVAYWDCGLSFRKNGQCVGRNQAPVMWICHHWMQEETTDRWGQSHPPRCITARDDRWIVRMIVIDSAATSQTIAQQVQTVTQHSVLARTIRRRFQQSGMSARRPLLRLHLTGSYRLCAANGAMNGGHGQRNGTILYLLTNPSSA
ncbi:transposable element Tc1 transposase [Trichonephila clavipes]|nr:transposable element Tc1 transposase [Trichonephila clavipes]